MDETENNETEVKTGARNNADDRQTIRTIRKLAGEITIHTRALEPTDDDKEMMSLEEMVAQAASGKAALRVKVFLPGVASIERPASPSAAFKALRPYADYTGPEYRVLGVPFGGPISGRDRDGEAFYDATNIWLNEGDSIPVTYYHGFEPDTPGMMQETPAVIGRAVLAAKDERGHWFDVRLDASEPLALRIANAADVKASSGAISHLVRMGEAGMIDVWPVGELALFDTNDWRLPANDYAVVEKKTPAADNQTAEGVASVEREDVTPAVKAVIAPQLPIVEEVPTGDLEMSDEVKPIDVEALAAALESKITAAIDAKFAKLAEEPGSKLAATLTAKEAPAVMKAAGLGDPDPDEDFKQWIFTGKGKIKAHTENVEIRSSKGELYYNGALQYGDTSEGQYLVPAGQYGRIIEKRKEQSLVDRLGATTFTTDSMVFYIPTEGTAMTKFSIVAEEADLSAAENEPTFSRLAVTMYDFWKLVKVSKQLEDSNNSGLDAYLANGLGNAWAATENYYVQIGSGSGAPQGAFVGGTAGLTLDATAAIAAGEVPELLGKLKIPYRNGAVLVMNRTTAAYLAQLFGTSAFSFRSTPSNVLTVGGEDLGIGYPVIPTEDCVAIGAGYKSMLFGNFSYYGWVRGNSLSVQRLVELYAQTGQIGLLANFRAGGGVLQAEAFQYATHPTA